MHKIRLQREFLKLATNAVLSNRPGGTRIGPKIPDRMSNNFAGREK